MNWNKVQYSSWDEAFRGQVAAVRQQSVRVAAYTQVLFLQACTDTFGKDLPGGKEQIRTQYGDLAYKCGLYHQLGKAVLPSQYQLLQKTFSDEELQIYRSYTGDGRLLVASLQEQNHRSRERNRMVEQPTENIPWLMIRDACEQHMERFDGSGYPRGRTAEQISPIAQIVGIAKELDRLASETKLENPFAYAYDTLIAQEGVLWSPELIRVLKDARSKCRAVYNKYIHYTQTLPKTVPLVEKRTDRPMGLTYLPMVADKEGTVAAYEAKPWFGAVANQPGQTQPMEEVHDMLVRTELVGDISFYFLYEAADALLRMQNCRLDTFVVLDMLPGFYSLPSQLQRLNQLFEDQPISREKLLLTLPAQVYATASKSRKEILGRYLRAGVTLLLDDYRPEQIPWQELKELGILYVRLAPELSVQRETAATIQTLRENGFTVLGKGADDYDRLVWQLACGIIATQGALTPAGVDEETLIRDSLAALR